MTTLVIPPHLFETRRISPRGSDSDIQREKLTVVRMAAEHHIHARIGVLFKKARLMFQRNNELIRVDIRHQSRKAHALVRAVARVFVILAAE